MTRVLNLSQEEQDEIYETVARERSKIDKAVEQMFRRLKGLSDVGQKHAIELFVSAWINAMFDAKMDALDFSEHLKSQIDSYLRAAKDAKEIALPGTDAWPVTKVAA